MHTFLSDFNIWLFLRYSKGENEELEFRQLFATLLWSHEIQCVNCACEFIGKSIVIKYHCSKK